VRTSGTVPEGTVLGGPVLEENRSTRTVPAGEPSLRTVPALESGTQKRGCEEMRLKISGFTAPFDFSVKFFK
jgi:hypothetical protein